MGRLFHVFFIFILILCYKYLPVFEPKGINYTISILCLGLIGFEVKKLWDSLSLNESRKAKIQKIGYHSLILLILISLILNAHIDYPVGNIRFLRILFIIVALITGARIVEIVAKSSISNFSKNSILFTYSTLSFIALIEIVFMFIALSNGSGMSYSGKLWTARYWNPINEYSLRDIEPASGKNNIFFVGDSFTAGWGVKKIEDRFGEVAAEELRKQGKPVNGINLGVCGVDTHQEYEIFESFIKETNISPDHIVLQFFVNDMDGFLPKINACNPPSQVPFWKKTLIEGSYLINYISNIYPDRSMSRLPKECNYPERLKYVCNNDTIWQKEELELDKFRDYCANNNIKMTLVFFPFMDDLTLAKKIGIEDRIYQYCLKNNIDLFNVTEAISTLPKEKRVVSIVDAHASSEVHRIVGIHLATFLNL
jgi:hypothetical protein